MASKSKGYNAALSNQVLIDDMEKIAADRAFDMAKNANERLQKQYISIVTRFYNDYKPQYYVRHHNRIKTKYKNRGMDLTMNGILGGGVLRVVKSKGCYFAGIALGTNRMYNDYDGTRKDVLKSFMYGYHGPEFQGIKRSTEPYPFLIKYAKRLTQEYQRACK